MKSVAAFTILDSVDSTNNYAMAQLHAGLAIHGSAWFTNDQFGGKGQRGKKWLGQAGEGIALSITIVPRREFGVYPFILNTVVANCCRQFLHENLKLPAAIKWPNDLYLRDRKAGVILIENNFRQNTWKWAVLGIGMNVNQLHFDPALPNPVSFKQLTGQEYDVEALARELQQCIMAKIDDPALNPDKELETYNLHLYKKEEEVTLKKQNAAFKTFIKKVNRSGQLITEDTMERAFEFGEVEWVIAS